MKKLALLARKCRARAVTRSLLVVVLAALSSSCGTFRVSVQVRPPATATIPPAATSVPTGTATALPPLEHARQAALALDGPVFDAVLAPDGGSVLLAFDAGSSLALARWDLSSATRDDGEDDLRLTTTSCPAQDVDLSLSPDGSLAAVALGKAVMLMDAFSGELLDAPAFISRHARLEDARSIAFSPQGTRYMVGGVNLARLDRADPGADYSFQGFYNPIGGLYVGPEYDEARASGLLAPHVIAYSPDGVRVAAGGGRFIGLWNAGNGTREQMLSGFDFVQSISFSPDSRALVFISDNGKLYRWVLSGVASPELVLDGGVGAGAAYSPDGRWLAVGMSDGSIQLWDAATLQAGREIQAHASRVTAVGFSTDGSRLLSASYDGTVVVWDVSDALEAGPVSERPISPIGSPEPLAAGQPLILQDIRMLDEQEGWAIDSTRHLLRTSDGGVHWRDVSPLPATFSAAGLFIFNDWTAWVTPETAPCYRAGCPAANLAEGIVWRTVDGGKSWVASQPFALGRAAGETVPYYRPLAVQFVDSQNGWLLVSVDRRMRRDFYRLYHTVDGGTTWSRQVDETSGPALVRAHGIAFFGPGRGTLAGEGMEEYFNGDHFFLTEDAGEGWQQMTGMSGVMPWRSCSILSLEIRALSPGTMSVDSVGQAFRSGNCDPAAEELHSLMSSLEPWKEKQTWKEAGFSFFMDDRLGWAFVVPGPGQANILQHTRDGGKTWLVVRRVAWEEAHFSFVDELTGWAIVRIGDQVTLVHTTNGGDSWEEIKAEVVVP